MVFYSCLYLIGMPVVYKLSYELVRKRYILHIAAAIGKRRAHIELIIIKI